MNKEDEGDEDIKKVNFSMAPAKTHCSNIFCICVREHSTKRTDGIIHRPCTRTTTHRPAQHELALCDRCHTAWASGAHGWVPAGHPRYTRADFGQEAVGGSTTTTRARDPTRDPRHAVRTPSVLFTRT